MADTVSGNSNPQKRRGGFVKGVIPPGAKPFKPGQSGNPRGVSAHVHELQKAAEEACTVDKVQALMDKLYSMGMDGDVPAAKLWLDRGLGAVREAPVDLTDAPPEVLTYLKDKIN